MLSLLSGDWVLHLFFLVGLVVFFSRKRVLRGRGIWISLGFVSVTVMSMLVKYGEDEEFHARKPIYTNFIDPNLLLSFDPHVEIYYPPLKRTRITAPYVPPQIELPKQSSIEALPNECLFEIFRKLHGKQDKGACACVSKRWLFLVSSIHCNEFEIHKSSLSKKDVIDDDNDEFNNEGFLTRYLEGKKLTDVRLAAIAIGTASLGGLGKLIIRGTNNACSVSKVGFEAIAKGCPSLRILSLWNLPSVGDDCLLEIAKGCKRIEKIDICNCPMISDESLIALAKNCPNLTSLTLESCAKIGNGSLEALGKSCSNLQSVSVNNCPLIGDRGISTLVSSATYVLSKIKLSNLNITDISLAVIGHYGKSVTELCLSSLPSVTEKGFWVMGKADGLQKLRFLSITSCNGVTDHGLETVMKGCPNIRQLYLARCTHFSDQGLLALIRGSMALDCLHLEECNRLTQVGILAAVSNCGQKLKTLAVVKCMGVRETVSDLNLFSTIVSLPPCKSLQSLTIRYCPGFGSLCLSIFGRLCPELRQIDLIGLNGLTDIGFIAFLRCCKQGLVKVAFSDCINLTDKIVSAMVEKHGSTLERLNMDGCNKITDYSLIALAKNCSSLYDLDVSKCSITDSGVIAIASAKQLNLQILSFSGCSHISEKSLPFLANLRQTLMGLNLRNCNLISKRAMDQLGCLLWRCDILS